MKSEPIDELQPRRTKAFDHIGRRNQRESGQFEEDQQQEPDQTA